MNELRSVKPIIKFSIIGDAADFTIKQTDTGYDCLLNGIVIPAVISQKLVVGEGVPKVVLEIAVKTYQGITKTLEADSR